MLKNTDNTSTERIVDNIEKNIDINDDDLYKTIYLA